MKIFMSVKGCDFMKFGYIYMTINKINNKKYIGQKTSPIFVNDYFGSGTYLKKAIDKYGKENFNIIILEWCYNKEDLNNAEKRWISYYNAVNDRSFYNIAKGGEGGGTNFDKYTEEDRARILKRYSEVQIERFKDPNEIAKVVRYGKENGMYGMGHLLSGGRNGRAKPVVVYKNSNFYKEFECEKDCLNYFKGLEKSLFKQSLKNNIYIKDCKIGINQYTERLKISQSKYQNYKFIHKENIEVNQSGKND